jgi:hypothetical protein
MRVQPRQQLLRIWRATARMSFRDGVWTAGGRHEPSSISDAEQLLCVMLPATETLRFRLDNPDETDPDVRAALRVLGDELAIPRQLVHALSAFMRRYADEDGIPTFAGGSYITASDPAQVPSAEQASVDLVESYAASIRLTLATIGFCRAMHGILSRRDLIDETVALEAAASKRLTAAMAGLMRSFAIFVFEVDSDEGRALLRTINQDRRANRRVLAELAEELSEVSAGLRDLSAGSGQEAKLERGRLFQCGWSWGVIAGAPRITWLDETLQRDGVALDAPYLYFTVVALDSITDLFSRRTRLDNLLDDEQQRLARALEIRWDLTQTYWAKIASFGDGTRWPLEDIPWCTIDDVESDYFSLLVTAIAARDLATRRANNDVDLSRLGQILTELANRGRITRRPFAGDPAVKLHQPGVTIPIEFAEEGSGPDLVYQATDFAPLLLKRTIAVAASINNIELRRRLLDLADLIWDHYDERRLDSGPGRDLWDQPGAVFPGIERANDLPTWHHTLRVVESLVLAAEMANTHPLRSRELSRLANDLLAEAEHLFDQEKLRGAVDVRERPAPDAAPYPNLVPSSRDAAEHVGAGNGFGGDPRSGLSYAGNGRPGAGFDRAPDGVDWATEPSGGLARHQDQLSATLKTVSQQLRWAREIIDEQPGTAAATLFEILAMLGGLAAARSDVFGAQ